MCGDRMSMWSTSIHDYGMTSMEADPGLHQSRTACCPRETVPDSCSCPDGCACLCMDCDCRLPDEGDDDV